MIIIEKANFFNIDSMGNEWNIVKIIEDKYYLIGLTTDNLIKFTQKVCYEDNEKYYEDIEISDLPKKYHLKYSSYYN